MTLRMRSYRRKSGPSLLVRLDRGFVFKNEIYASPLVSQNATETLRAAVATADNTYVANRSISVYAVEARSENA
jgi:hypothetical protein